MKHAPVFHADFIADYQEQIEALAAKNDEGGIHGLWQGVTEACSLLSRFPLAGSAVETRGESTLRKLILRTIPFVVWYLVPKGQPPTLVRLFHMRQRRLGRHRR